MFDLDLYINEVTFKRMDTALVCEKTRTWKPTWKIVDVGSMYVCVCMYVCVLLCIYIYIYMYMYIYIVWILRLCARKQEHGNRPGKL